MKSLQVPEDIARYEDHSSNQAQGPEESSVRVAQEVQLPAVSLNTNQAPTIAPDSTSESIRQELLSNNDAVADVLELVHDTTHSPRSASIASKPVDGPNKLDSETLVKRIVSEMREAEQDTIKAVQPAKPIRFKDAVGRNFLFPFDLSNTWSV